MQAPLGKHKTAGDVHSLQRGLNYTLYWLCPQPIANTELPDSGSLSIAVTQILRVWDFLTYGGTVTSGYMKFYLWPGGPSLLFVKTGVKFPCFESTELKSSICWWVSYGPRHFCIWCLPLGPYCKGRDLTCCCRSWAQKRFWVCERTWHTWAHDLGLQEILHVKQPIKNVKQAEQSSDLPCHVLFAVNFFPRHVRHDWFFALGFSCFKGMAILSIANAKSLIFLYFVS